MTWLAAVTLLALYLRQTVMRRSVSDAWMMTAAHQQLVLHLMSIMSSRKM